LKTSFGV